MIEAEPGENIYTFAERLTRIANRRATEVKGIFNDIELNCYFKSHPLDIAEKYSLLHKIRRLEKEHA